MKKFDINVAVLILIILGLISFSVYSLYSLFIVDSESLFRTLGYAIGIILSIAGIFIVLPIKARIFIEAFFKARTIASNSVFGLHGTYPPEAYLAHRFNFIGGRIVGLILAIVGLFILYLVR